MSTFILFRKRRSERRDMKRRDKSESTETGDVLSTDCLSGRSSNASTRLATWSREMASWQVLVPKLVPARNYPPRPRQNRSPAALTNVK